MPRIYTTLGQIIRHKRESIGLSLRGFAKLLGVSATYLSELERDHTTATERRLVQIAKMLGFDPAWLCSKDPRKYSKASIVKQLEALCSAIESHPLDGENAFVRVERERARLLLSRCWL